MLSKKILLIDDDADLVAALKARLIATGYQVATAGDGKEGFSQVIIFDPDLIILDSLMPVMNGLQFMEKYRDNKSLHKIPVIVISARAGVRDFFSDMPIKDFIVKPLNMDTFLGQIAKALGVSVAAGGPPAATKRLLLVGVDKFVAHKVSEFFKAEKWEVLEAKNDAEAYASAQSFAPDAILCQYWNPAWEGSELNTKALAQRLAQDHALSRIHFEVYCTHGPLLEAMQLFPESQLIKYNESGDLLKELEKRFGIYHR